MDKAHGIGKLDRTRITKILRSTQHTISVAETANVLSIPKQHAAKLLARWADKRWLSRIKRGLYIPVPLESATTDIPLEDPWIIAEKIYQPCYIAAWSAAEYWGLTEQIFRTVVVFTLKKLKNHRSTIKSTKFLLHTVSKESMFGLQTLWRGQIKVSISNPTRTILDLLNNPKMGGGIRSTLDMFMSYLNSEYKNLPLLVDYAKRLNNGAVFKRLGFLLEQYAPTELETLEACKKNLTTGKVKIDNQLAADKLITHWRLWVPENWKSK